MARIFITGIAGFLGNRLAAHLRDQGHEVWGNDNLCGGELANLPKGVGFITTDCRYSKEMAHQLKEVKPEILYHCAATPHEGLSIYSPSYVFDNVAQASIATFSAAIQAGVKKVVFLSSMARYGKGYAQAYEYGGTDEPPFSETYQTAPVDPYGIAKVAAEQALRVLGKIHGIKYQIAVPHNIIGVGQCYTDPYRNVVSIFMNRLKQGKPGIIYGDGSQVRCFSPVEDILPCLTALGLDDSLPNGEVWNIGPDTGEITIRELYAKVLAVAGSILAPILYPPRAAEVPMAFCTADKARASLGYKSATSLDDCLRAMWDAIPEGGRPFRYENHPLEIITDATNVVWKERLM